MFLRRSSSPVSSPSTRGDFAYLDDSSIYLDTACQSLRPQPVINALTTYYQEYNACGGRVKYAWGQRVDEAVAGVRRAVLEHLKLSAKTYTTSFTLNTTYGLNLLLSQLPTGRYSQVVTSDIEHNSVFLPTMTLARRLDIPRVVLERADDGGLIYEPEQLSGAIVVLNTVSNIDGRQLTNLAAVVRDAHQQGGIVIIDAAQTLAHNSELLHSTEADALCFSGHKLYSASLGVVVARRELIQQLDIGIIGGGMVSDVQREAYELLPDEPETRLEPGLQAWGEIIALGAALEWLKTARFEGQKSHERIATLSRQLYDGLQDIPGLTVFNQEAAPVVSVYADKADAHQLALYLSHAGIMVRSGYFCAHYYLRDVRQLPPLLRFSIGLHNTPHDIDTALGTMRQLMKGVA